jgi:hypothetical protein
VPANDPFSLAGLHRPWVAYSWLFEVLVYGLYRWLGLAGVLAYRVALSVAVVAVLHRLVARREPRFLPALGLTALGTLALGPDLTERPWLFTILFTALTLDVLLDLRRGRPNRMVWLLPALYALWANIHIQFIYGLLLIGLACVEPLLDRLLGRASPSPGAGQGPRRRGWACWGLLGACALATLLNPYHVRVYGVVLEYASQPVPFQLVGELRAMEFRSLSDWLVLGLAGAAAFALGRRRPLRPFDMLLLAAAAFFAFRARRDVWFLVLAALSILTGGRPRVVAVADRFTWAPRRVALLAAALAGLVVAAVCLRGLSGDGLERKLADAYPVRAAAVVRERGYRGPLYNDFNWGGYLIWSLPELPVALDGRTNLHGDERLLRFDQTWTGAAGWHDDPDLSAAGVVIAPANCPLTSLLLLDPRFVQVHQDPVAVIFVPRSALRP